MPEWLAVLIVALGTFRLVRLVGWDDITATPRAWVSGLTDEEYNEWAELVYWNQQQGVDPWSGGVYPLDWSVFEDGTKYAEVHKPSGRKSVPVGRLRFKLAQLLRCPWCVGFWVSLLVSASLWTDSGATLRVLTPFALSASVGLVAKHLDQ